MVRQTTGQKLLLWEDKTFETKLADAFTLEVHLEVKITVCRLWATNTRRENETTVQRMRKENESNSHEPFILGPSFS